LKIKLDENIPTGFAVVLSSLGHEVDTVEREGLAGSPDEEVWKHAQREGRFLVTQDLDFSDTRKFTPGSHHGILLVRLRDPGRQALSRRLEAIFRSQDAEQWQGCFVVASEHKLRIRREP